MKRRTNVDVVFAFTYLIESCHILISVYVEKEQNENKEVNLFSCLHIAELKGIVLI